MARASITPPYPLLFDCLLTSSWAWFAICLATLATSLRALRIFHLRQRLVSSLSSQPPSSIPFPSSSAIQSSLLSSVLSENPSFPSIASDRSFRLRSRSKSTSALETLHRNGEGLLSTGFELLSSGLDIAFTPNVKKIASAAKHFHDHSLSEKTQQNLGPCGFSPTTNNRRDELHNLNKLGLDSDDCLGVGLGFDSETLVQENETSCSSCFEEQQLQIEEDIPSWLPSWAYSLFGPSQISLSFPSAFSQTENSVRLRAMPCFEEQFGWDRLLESKLGTSWNRAPGYSRLATQSSNVVKMWPGQEKKLLKTLDANALAFDMCSRTSVACTGNFTGEISLWELGRKSYSKVSASFTQPVVALSMNSEQGATMVGSSKGIGLWDQRSSICIPLRFWNAMSPEDITVSALKSRGIGLCVAKSDSTLSTYDLRKLHCEPLYTGGVPKRAAVSSQSDDEAYRSLLEMLTCDFEEDFWEEGGAISTGNAVDAQKGSSLLSRVAAFMRALSTSVL